MGFPILVRWYLYIDWAPWEFEWSFRQVIFKLISVTDGWGISCEIGLRWMLLDLTDDKSILVQVMAWCRQARSHYLSQCWPRSLSPYGVTRPQWVNSSAPGRCDCDLKLVVFKLLSRIAILKISSELHSGECYKSSLMIGQHWFER